MALKKFTFSGVMVVFYSCNVSSHFCFQDLQEKQKPTFGKHYKKAKFYPQKKDLIQTVSHQVSLLTI